MIDAPIRLETRCLSSLSKVFADSELHDQAVNRGTALWGEVYTFQVAFRSSALAKFLQITVESELRPWIAVRSVALSPSDLPTFPDPDEGYLRTTPGLYPDLLFPSEMGVHAVQRQWRSVWITVALPARGEAGASGLASYGIAVKFADQEGQLLGQERFTLDVIPADLPEQRLIHTEWFHCDCIATRYDVDILGEEHWRLIEAYARNAVEHGVNMLLTPLFTPPLDTRVGGERPTVQLIGVEQAGADRYRFDFSKLERWIAMCRRVGVQYYEMSHLFTQWGAKHAPKIVALTDSGTKRIFGWETDAGGEAYRTFLGQFLPELVAFIRAQGIEEQVYFHVSDEPNMNHLDSYRQASEILKRHLKGFKFLDALSDYEFYKLGLMDVPVPASNHIEPFLEQEVDPLWTYYCCSQGQAVSNRFFALPSARNRVLGAQLYKFRIQGFLHWGFNFWYSQYSTRPIDPFRVTDADCAFPSGDAFVVYPGEDGPLDSIRWEVFREALQDLRALELLESLTGREKTLEVLEEGLAEPLTFSKYPVDADWALNVRDRVNAAIRGALQAR